VERGDYVVVKMDIEGMEYEVLLQAIVSGLFDSLIDKIAVEWHHNNPYVFGNPQGQGDPERARVHQKYLDYYSHIAWVLRETNLDYKLSIWGRR
jgi:hypothetical protein